MRPLVDAYLRATRLEQHWAMFANVSEVDEYLRLRYYVGPRAAGLDGPTRIVTELVMPGQREDEPRLLKSFRSFHRDKAVDTSIEFFARRRRPEALRPDTRPEELPDALAPVLRYFSRRFTQDHLRPQEVVLRTEAWYGTAPVIDGRASRASEDLERRFEVLKRYYAGPIQEPAGVARYPRYEAVEREGDIQWTLAYFEGG